MTDNNLLAKLCADGSDLPGLIRLVYFLHDFEYLRRYRPIRTVLDLGSSFGIKGLYLAKTFPEIEKIVGIEINQEYHTIAVNHRDQLGISSEKVELHCGDLNSFSPTCSFDLIICSHVLEHIEQDQEVVSKCYQWLNPDGFLFIDCPNSHGRTELNEIDRTEGHVRPGYTSSSYRALLKGWHIVRLGTRGGSSEQLISSLWYLNSYKHENILSPYFTEIFPTFFDVLKQELHQNGIDLLCRGGTIQVLASKKSRFTSSRISFYLFSLCKILTDFLAILSHEGKRNAFRAIVNRTPLRKLRGR